MTDPEFDRVKTDLAAFDVRVEPLNYAMCIANDAAIASRGAEERAERMRRGEREVNVYPSRESKQWVRGYLATAEQVRALLAAGARLGES